MCSISDDPEQMSYFVVKLRQAGKSGTARVKRVANGVRKTLRSQRAPGGLGTMSEPTQYGVTPFWWTVKSG